MYAGVTAFCQAITDNRRTAAVLENHPGLSELRMLSPSPSKAEPNCNGLDEDGLHITARLVPVGGNVCVGLGGVVFWEDICHVCGL